MSVRLSSCSCDSLEIAARLQELAASIARREASPEDNAWTRNAILEAIEELRSHGRGSRLHEAQELVAAYAEFVDIVRDYLIHVSPEVDLPAPTAHPN
jgi:hypothetical protein